MLSDWLRPTPPGAQCALFVLAHPDDEFFCLPLIEAEHRGGRQVVVVYLTDGGPTALTREDETRRALSSLGGERLHLVFAGHEHGWPDGLLFEHLAPARQWLERFVAELPPIARVYVTAFEGGHHDHDCCFGLVAALARDGALKGITCLQFPLYTGRGLPGALFRCMSPIDENGEVLSYALGHREALRCWGTASAYPSQWRTWIALGPASLPAYLARRTITLQRVEPQRSQQAPHPGVPYYQRRFGVSQDAVLSALRSL